MLQQSEVGRKTAAGTKTPRNVSWNFRVSSWNGVCLHFLSRFLFCFQDSRSSKAMWPGEEKLYVTDATCSTSDCNDAAYFETGRDVLIHGGCFGWGGILEYKPQFLHVPEIIRVTEEKSLDKRLHRIGVLNEHLLEEWKTSDAHLPTGTMSNMEGANAWTRTANIARLVPSSTMMSSE